MGRLCDLKNDTTQYRTEMLPDRVPLSEELLREGLVDLRHGLVVALSSSVRGRPASIFAPMVSKKPGITRVQSANSRPSDRARVHPQSEGRAPTHRRSAARRSPRLPYAHAEWPTAGPESRGTAGPVASARSGRGPDFLLIPLRIIKFRCCWVASRVQGKARRFSGRLCAASPAHAIVANEQVRQLLISRSSRRR
jgi:hypothetical protein